jgi:ectoine hydroxylase-related dioxygenase (phytanoyl-CoA dioxygenase family)
MNALTTDQRSAYDEDGYVVLRGLLGPETDLDPVIVEYEGVLDRLAHRLVEAGEIASAHEELPFGRRLSQIYLETRRVFAGHFDCTLSMASVNIDSPIWVGPAVFRLLRHERILDVLEDLIGGEIYSNPVQHVRIKPPEKYLPHVYRDERTGRVAGFGVGATPWHQDNGVVLPLADATEMTTVWVAVTDATVQNGCLEVIRGSHRDGLLRHCASAGLGLAIPDPLLSLDRVVTCPMQRGDVLFMHRRTCHSSLPNRSQDVRISYDLRYNPVGQPTGREIFPGFVARSRSDPASELHDADAWAQLWRDTRERLAGVELPVHHRWNSDDPVCA